VQGFLGNSWFIGALNLISDNEEFIRGKLIDQFYDVEDV
jgi:hypothetical protein